MSDWQPQVEGVTQILQTLHDVDNPDPQVQRSIHSALQTFKTNPEFNFYLSFIFTLTDQPANVRTCAGLLLKNNVHRMPENPREFTYVKNQIVKVIGDPQPIVRRTAGSIITTILGVGRIVGWDGLLPFLVSCLDNPDKNVVDGAFYALRLICEDHSRELDSESCGRPLNFLLPKFLSFFKHEDPELRNYGVTCILRFLHDLPPPVVSHISNFMEGFFYLAQDPQALIRKKVIHSFIILIDQVDGAQLVVPFLPRIMDFIIFCMKGNDEDLAFAATEFWRVISEHEEICVNVVTPMLKDILPVLLTRMMYSNQELAAFGSCQEDAHIPDRPENVPPATWSSNRDKDDEDQSDYSGWTIRKCSAESLDFLSRPFAKGFLEVLLPLVDSGLKSSNWLSKESSVLALGCVALGQYYDMRRHLPMLVPYLFDLTRDEKPLIRSISCWTLSRYSLWILKQEDKERYFHRLVSELLTRMSDKNKEVQKAACCGLAQISETAAREIIPYAETILKEFARAFPTFQRRNLFVLYDAIGAIAQSMGSSLNNPKYLSVLLPPLLSKWNQVSDDNSDLFPLLDCFSHVAVALGSSFIQYVPPVFGRCVRLIENSILQLTAHQQNPTGDPPEREFLICSLDVISNLCEALKGEIGQFVRNSSLVGLILQVLENTSADFSQSSYALVGDLARHCPDVLVPVLGRIIPILLKGTYFVRFVEMCNNAFWALGEIVVAVCLERPTNQPPEVITPYLGSLLERAYTIIDSSDVPELIGIIVGQVYFSCFLKGGGRGPFFGKGGKVITLD
eukprot:TRINITY_DN2196_c0_g1_i1.p1 TRINITY_DN2196_c0_g1~~TRINITY_DN2196_c0_g1_i1.p1  ORF type:complete len:792 (+),score=128.14 TRINITY_DN2196_c0_g1_i1:60-2435(+)